MTSHAGQCDTLVVQLPLRQRRASRLFAVSRSLLQTSDRHRQQRSPGPTGKAVNPERCSRPLGVGVVVAGLDTFLWVSVVVDVLAMPSLLAWNTRTRLDQPLFFRGPLRLSRNNRPTWRATPTSNIQQPIIPTCPRTAASPFGHRTVHQAIMDIKGVSRRS